MKKTFKIYFLALLLIGNNLKSQNVTAPTNNIEVLLCKKWVIDYALMGDTKMDAPPNQKDIYFDFKKNKTFTTTIGATKDSYTGAWKYDSSKKVIKLIVRGKVGFIVSSLTDSELTMITDAKSGMSGLKVVYKIKTP